MLACRVLPEQAMAELLQQGPIVHPRVRHDSRRLLHGVLHIRAIKSQVNESRGHVAKQLCIAPVRRRIVDLLLELALRASRTEVPDVAERASSGIASSARPDRTPECSPYTSPPA